MITMNEAAEIAKATVNRNYREVDDVLVLIPEETIDTSYGWVFFFDSRRRHEGNDPDCELAGNSPILVLADNGATVFLGTHRPAEELLKEWESKNT